MPWHGKTHSQMFWWEKLRRVWRAELCLGHGAFPVLRTLLLPLLSSFLVDSDLVTSLLLSHSPSAIGELYSNRDKIGSVCCCNKF